ncbi:hypothetical protein DIURU_000022 [Diutina rugosa]|uniref:Rho-GAP domain-containing protein n=1 Tax=Diutina rugosa TaxID=5481 RepID=A0A642UZU7_DIURU|nr:uncharacterized protein DIURU_000022 [Diutina rugosa]KAA8908709.1 hypothetical protein DIURU_000022 [Diutina rugosa]
MLSSDSVNDMGDGDFSDHSPTKADSLQAPTGPSQSIPIPQSSGTSEFNFATSPLSPRASEFLRPLLHHKSRSSTNVNAPNASRGRSNSNTNMSEASTSIRQHRDSFLQHNPLIDTNSKYFGVPLDVAIDQASAKISIFSDSADDTQSYGRIPIVVAKCGVYLKKKGLTVEGIFRVGGSSKRLKELQQIFDSPPDFGKKLSWDGYTVHDAASILRRYLNALPEPLIPLDMYESFRDPLRERPRIINYMKFKAENPNKSLRSQDDADDVSPLTEANVDRFNSAGDDAENAGPSVTTPTSERPRKGKNYRKLTRDVHCAIEEYKQLVSQLPNLSKQLLFYILDLLAMVQNHSCENLMSSRNLAAIFQPSILSHPDHDMDPDEYALSQSVVEFLIQYAYKLLPNHGAHAAVAAPAPAPSTSTSVPVFPAPTAALLTEASLPPPTTRLDVSTSAGVSPATSTTTTPLETEPLPLHSPEPKGPPRLSVDTAAVADSSSASTAKDPVIVVSSVEHFPVQVTPTPSTPHEP